MGYSYSTTKMSRAEYIKRDILAEHCFQSVNPKLFQYELLDYSITASGVWCLVKLNNIKENTISYDLELSLLTSSNGCWGHKTMPLNSGLFYYDCTMRLVNKYTKLTLNDVVHPNVREWLIEYDKFHQHLINAKQWKNGDILSYMVRNEKIKFLYWANKSKTKFVGHRVDTTELFKYKVVNFKY